MAKKIIIGLLGVMVLLLLALTVLFYTDHRYSYAVRTYRALSAVESMEISYNSHMGMDENQLGIHGTAAMTFSPRAAFIDVYTDLPFLGDQKIMDIYSEEKEVYHKFNLAFLPWQRGIPLLSEDAFNPANLTELSPKADLVPMLRFLASLKKEEDAEKITYYTTDFFTPEEFKKLLSETLSLDSMDTKEWEMEAYRISASFDKEEKLLKEVRIEFTNRVRNVTMENEFSLEILSVNSVDAIEKPVGLPEE